MRRNLAALLLFATLSLVLSYACGDSIGDIENGRCSEARAPEACGNDCAFPPANIDCQTACQNVADICAASACNTNCSGLNQDVPTCVIACQATRNLNCTNVSFGCFSQESNCEAVGTCVLANL